jgi:hypothetical protein
MSGPPEKVNPFKPAQPVIPGVPQKPVVEEQPEERPETKPKAPIVWPPPPPPPPPLWQSRPVMIGAGVAAILLMCGAALAWRALSTAPPPAPVVLDTPTPSADSPAAGAGSTAGRGLPVAPGAVASVADLAKPWTVVKFQMQRPTHEIANALVIRLPSAPGYWGLLSVAPYGQCELELESDLRKLREQYSYAAIHPMVVDSCTQTVYDPLSLGSSSGVWIRGKIAAGPGIRPPFEVEIKVERGEVIASRSE